jgi:catechol 2,3-dioxygenase-like lactoylglutathione lyase family enzyme
MSGGVTGVDHVGIGVSDMERALRFWRDTLGLEQAGRGTVEWEHLDRLTGADGTVIEWAELRIPGGSTVELQQYHRPTGTPLAPGGDGDAGRSHLSLLVRDIETVLEQLHAAGAPSRSAAPVEIPRGAYAGAKAVYVHDPDGFAVELIERPPTARPFTTPLLDTSLQ